MWLNLPGDMLKDALERLSPAHLLHVQTPELTQKQLQSIDMGAHQCGLIGADSQFENPRRRFEAFEFKNPAGS